MPSHTIQSALIELFYEGEGAPWKYTQWKDLTGISHGLFPEDDSQLPKGWTRQTAHFVASYFDQYNRKLSQDDRIKFAAARKGSSEVPGRDIWREFVTNLWKTNAIHSKITIILSDEGLHPIVRALASKGGSIDKLPSFNDYVGEAIDPVGKALFGDECVDHGGQHVDMMFRTSLRNIIYRTWLNIKNQAIRSKNRIVGLETDATNAFENLNRDEMTKAKLRAVIIKVSRWKVLAQALQITDHLERLQPMEDDLMALMIGLGAKLKEPSSKSKSASKVNNQMVLALRSKFDMNDIINLYLDFFNTPNIVDSVPLDEQHATLGIQLGGNSEGSADLGIEIEGGLSSDTLCSRLGFSNGLPILFNRYRHRAGLTRWNPDSESLFEPEIAERSEDMERIVLHWHQIAGLHAIIRMNFTAQPDIDRTFGCLIADEVGLGKTFLSALIIAFLSDIVLRYSLIENSTIGQQVLLPPILKETPYLGKHKILPKLPHLIIVPGTLLSQWRNALETVFAPKSFVILEYPGGKSQREQFWEPNSAFHNCESGANLIILASHSALQNDFSSLYSWQKPTKSSYSPLPWEGIKCHLNSTVFDERTLYGRKYLSITLDEAQAFRNMGAKHCAALQIMECALMRIVMTATPLQTSTKDVASMGRLIGIEHFLTEAAYSEEKEDATLIRQVKRTNFEESDDGEDAVRECQMAIAQRMQEHFADRILRRTVVSKDWKGNSLIVLPPYKNLTLIVKPTQREMEIISELADNVKESVSSSNGLLQIVSRSFYIEHRMCVGYARYSLEEKIPEFKSLEDWEEKKSTKFDICARLCKYLLTSDDAPDIEVENGNVKFPALDPVPPGKTQSRKILISQEFPSLCPLLRNVLKLYGINPLHIDGQMSFQKRANVVKEFCTKPQHRVLIMSSVGSVGLNLTAASTIIFVDQPWSAQDELQIRGRAHRQPQENVVTCYHILADETADIVLAALARGKHHMMDKMLNLFSGKTIADPNDDDCDDNTNYMHEPSSKKQKKKRGHKSERLSRKKLSNTMVTDEAEAGTSKMPVSEAAEVQAAPLQAESAHMPDADIAIVLQETVDLDNSQPINLALSSDNPDDNAMLGIEDQFIPASPVENHALNPFGIPTATTPPRESGQRRNRALEPDTPELLRYNKRMCGVMDYRSSPVGSDSSDEGAVQPLVLSPTHTHTNATVKSSQSNQLPPSIALSNLEFTPNALASVYRPIVTYSRKSSSSSRIQSSQSHPPPPSTLESYMESAEDVLQSMPAPTKTHVTRKSISNLPAEMHAAPKLGGRMAQSASTPVSCLDTGSSLHTASSTSTPTQTAIQTARLSRSSKISQSSQVASSVYERIATRLTEGAPTSSLTVPAVPDFRRSTSLKDLSHKTTLQPPSASTQSKNPFKGSKGKRKAI